MLKQTMKMHFAHANGFPAGSYNKLFNHLSPQFEVFALDKFAHNEHFPLNDNWQNQVDELIAFVEQHISPGEKVVAVGHSFGAVTSYMAVCQKPHLFSQLIMLDPPLITGLARYIFRFAKSNKLIDKITPAGITSFRAKSWKHGTDLVEYFSKKALFKDFDRECLQDYVNAVITEQEQDLTLNFDVETEANIFRTIPHNLPNYYNKLTVPTTLITGKFSDVCVPVLYKPFLRGNKEIKHRIFPTGKHMFPLEFPVELAAVLNELIKND